MVSVATVSICCSKSGDAGSGGRGVAYREQFSET
jgi:hypothetical protein